MGAACTSPADRAMLAHRPVTHEFLVAKAKYGDWQKICVAHWTLERRLQRQLLSRHMPTFCAPASATAASAWVSAAVFLPTDRAKRLVGAREMPDLEIAEAAAGAVKTGTGHEPSKLRPVGYQRNALRLGKKLALSPPPACGKH